MNPGVLQSFIYGAIAKKMMNAKLAITPARQFVRHLVLIRMAQGKS